MRKETTLERTDKAIAGLLARVLPSYHKPHVTVVATDTVDAVAAGRWDGGSVNYYTPVSLAAGCGMPVVPCERTSTYSQRYTLRSGAAVLGSGVFCGRKSQATLYVHPDDFGRFVGEPVDVTNDVACVCYYTRNLKNSYGGRKNLRMNSAIDDGAITAERWGTAKAGAIEAGLLKRNGAITAAGTNAANGYTRVRRQHRCLS